MSPIGHKNGIENKDKEIKPRLKKDEIKRKKFTRSTRYGSSRFFFLLGWDQPEKGGKK